MRLFRIEKEIYKEIFPPIEPLQFDGRWHTAGMWVVYCSQSIALAKLECLASASFLPDGRILKTIEVSNNVILKEIQISDLPKGWNDIGSERNLSHITLDAMKEGFLGMIVPSVLSPLENNVLLFPHHRDFYNEVKQIKIYNAYFDVQLK